MEETSGTTTDDLDEDGAERPRLPRAVMDRRSRPGPEPTTLEAVGDQWRYALVVVQAGDGDDDDDDGSKSKGPKAESRMGLLESEQQPLPTS